MLKDQAANIDTLIEDLDKDTETFKEDIHSYEKAHH